MHLIQLIIQEGLCLLQVKGPLLNITYSKFARRWGGWSSWERILSPSDHEPPCFSGLTAAGKHLRGLTAVSLRDVQKLIVYSLGILLATWKARLGYREPVTKWMNFLKRSRRQFVETPTGGVWTTGEHAWITTGYATENRWYQGKHWAQSKF